jgi:hypothetical protein
MATLKNWEYSCRNLECGSSFESKDRDLTDCPKCKAPLRRIKVIWCACGDELGLYDPMTNTCGCGREYNGSGQELAPRRFWGEETGESF